MNYKILPLLLSFTVAGILSLFLSSCASVTIKDATPDDEYGDNYEDGYLFYPRRPYLYVKKEFPVEGESGYITAQITDDGIKFRSPWDNKEQVYPFNALFIQGQNASGASKFTSENINGESGDGAKNPQKTTETESKNNQVLGQATATAGYNPAVKEIEPLGELFDIVYLPDADNPRVLKAKALLGLAEVSIAYGPGSTLNTFQTTTDNREFGYIVKDLIETTVDVAKTLAGDKLGISKFTSAQVKGFRSQYKSGNSVLLKYTYTAYATPNLSPLIKEREFAEYAKIKSETVGYQQDQYLVRPEYPFSRFAFKVRREFKLIVEDLSPSPVISKSDGNAEDQKKLVKSQQKSVNEIFDGQAITVDANDGSGDTLALTFDHANLDAIKGDSEVKVIWLYQDTTPPAPPIAADLFVDSAKSKTESLVDTGGALVGKKGADAALAGIQANSIIIELKAK